MQDRNHAYCLACEVDDLFRGVGEVEAHQDAYHQAVAVVDVLQTFRCLVVEVACLDAQCRDEPDRPTVL